MFDEEKDLLKRIAEASKAIRQKHRLLKVGRETAEQSAQEFFKPMTKPLEKIVQHNNKKEELQIKEEMLDNINNNLQLKEEILNEKEDILEDIWKNSFKKENGDKLNDSFHSAIDDDDEIPPLQLKKENISPPKQKSKVSNNFSQKIKKDSLNIPTTTIIPEKQIETEKSELSEVLQEYLLRSANKTSDMDLNTGVRHLQTGKRIGSKDVSFKDNYIHINGQKYYLTKGLLELIFKKDPRQNLIQSDDLDVYKKIVLNTDAYRKQYNSRNDIRIDNTAKFRDIIKPMLTTKGDGLLPTYMLEQRNKIDYVYWDDPNELVDRLRLLISAQAAGNTHHSNEIISIIEELRESEIIY